MKVSLKRKILLLGFAGFYSVARRLSYLTKRDDDIWVFIKRRKLVDNSKYLFIQLPEDVNKVFVSLSKKDSEEMRKKGFESYYLYSKEGIKKVLSAGVFISDQGYVHYGWYCGRALRVQLWHGIPFKKACYDDKFNFHLRPPSLFWKFMHFIVYKHDTRDYDLVCGISNMYNRIMKSQFRLPANKFKITGFPRTDIFYKRLEKFKNWEISVDIEILKKVLEEKEKGKRIVLYAPTFRSSEKLRGSEKKMLHNLVKSLKKEKDLLILCKLHQCSKANLQKTKALFKNFYIIDPISDAYPILKYVDILITDYSSIFFDFLHLNRPIIFYAPDLEEYIKYEREFYFNYESFVPGPIARSGEEVAKILKKGEEREKLYEKKRKKILREFYKYRDGDSGRRVIREIKKLLSKRGK